MFFFISLKPFVRGGGPKTNSALESAKLSSLKTELEVLNKQQASLDEQIKIMEMNKSILIEDEENKKSLLFEREIKQKI